MQLNLFYALNGIATAAQNGTYNGGLPDQNAMSAIQDAYQNLVRQLGTQYDASTSSTSSSAVVVVKILKISAAPKPLLLLGLVL